MNLLFEFLTVNEMEKLQILTKLIEDLDKQDIIRHFTPLHIAAKNGSIEAFILVAGKLVGSESKTTSTNSIISL